MHLLSSLLALLFIVTLNAAPFRTASAKSTLPLPPALFVDAPALESAMVPGQPVVDPIIIRSRQATINVVALDQASSDQKLLLNLFPDVSLTAVLYQSSGHESSAAWVGRVDGVPFSQVLIVSGRDQINAEISLPDAYYQVRFQADGLHTVQQIDPAQFPPEMEPIEVERPQSAARTQHADMPADSANTIDVLVLYTPAARSGQGGLTAIRNLIDLAILGTNTSFRNSGVVTRLNLVHTAEIAYTEDDDMGTDLDRLRSVGDGFLDQAHALRDAYHADLVSLIVSGGNYCGIAYQMSYVTPDFADLAFSVVSRTCATGNYSFAHELGHNLGARHDWFVDNGTSPSAYSHGYISVSGRWRTIMAYNNECAARGSYCSRIPYWSNPTLTYSGAEMGIHAGSNSFCRMNDVNHPPCDADDHRTLNETALIVANFRARGSLPLPTSGDSPAIYLPTILN